VTYRPDVDALTAAAVDGRAFAYQVDGDHLGDATSLVFRHEPEVLDLVVP
jgi:hypothetical protein